MTKKFVLIFAIIAGLSALVLFRFSGTQQASPVAPSVTPSPVQSTQHKAMPTANPAITTRTKPLALNTTADVSNNRDDATSSTIVLWEELLAKLAQGNTEIALENALIARLRQESNDEIYSKLVDVFRQRTLSPAAQQLLVSLLGEITTYEAGETLMQLLEEHLISSPDVKLTALHAINKFTPELWYEHSNAELAPVFESAWQKIDDPTFLSAIAHVMAKIGTPKSLSIFTQTLAENSSSKRVELVKQAMADFENPALINQFATNLQSASSKNVQWASGYALANMGQSAATSALFDWATRANASQAVWVKDWFEIATSTTPEFVQWLDSNLSTQQFNSLEIKQTVETALADVKAKE